MSLHVYMTVDFSHNVFAFWHRWPWSVESDTWSRGNSVGHWDGREKRSSCCPSTTEWIHGTCRQETEDRCRCARLTWLIVVVLVVLNDCRVGYCSKKKLTWFCVGLLFAVECSDLSSDWLTYCTWTSVYKNWNRFHASVKHMEKRC